MICSMRREHKDTPKWNSLSEVRKIFFNRLFLFDCSTSQTSQINWQMNFFTYSVVRLLLWSRWISLTEKDKEEYYLDKSIISFDILMNFFCLSGNWTWRELWNILDNRKLLVEMFWKWLNALKRVLLWSFHPQSLHLNKMTKDKIFNFHFLFLNESFLLFVQQWKWIEMFRLIFALIKDLHQHQNISHLFFLIETSSFEWHTQSRCSHFIFLLLDHSTRTNLQKWKMHWNHQ